MKNNFFEGFKNFFNGFLTGGAANNENTEQLQDDVVIDDLIATINPQK